ncbi:MAG TPA: sensor domain-containing diguanylate cyclase [Candidatus Cybelea sp.]|nr:sensor domain-containing diguanylate cyclase [Candidatus Cybelea sp.]
MSELRITLAGTNSAAPQAQTLQLPAATLLTEYPGPAAVLDRTGRAIDGNVSGTNLAEQLRSADPAFLSAVGEGKPRQQRCHIEGRQGGQAYDIAFLPLEGSPLRCLMLARDATLERNLTQALVVSRQLFKDLVACSSDFAWETKADGTLGFVSPRGALGFTARELEGRKASELVCVPPPGIDSVFESRAALDGVEVWLNRSDGSPGCFEVSCTPSFDAEQSWRGTRGVCRDVTASREREAELKRAHELVAELSRTDELTGLPNRRAFVDELSRRLAHLDRHGRSGALLFIDLDSFKPINDRFGHQRGDEALRDVSNLIRKTSRAGDTAARLGGDEFVLWLEEVDGPAAQAKAAALSAAVGALDAAFGGLGFGASIGVALAETDDTVDAILARADRAMYEAKRLRSRGAPSSG